MAIPELRSLSPEQIVEAANNVLTSRLKVDDPALAAERVAKLAGLDAARAGDIETLARDAAESDPTLLGELLAGALNDLAETEPASRETVVDAVRAAGDKQTVVGVEILALGFLVLCGYVVIKSGGAESRSQTVKVTKRPDGRIEVTINTVTKYFDPLSAMGKLLGKVWPSLGD